MVLGPPVERLESGYPFSCSLFSRGTLPTKQGERRALLGDLVLSLVFPRLEAFLIGGKTRGAQHRSGSHLNLSVVMGFIVVSTWCGLRTSSISIESLCEALYDGDHLTHAQRCHQQAASSSKAMLLRRARVCFLVRYPPHSLQGSF